MSTHRNKTVACPHNNCGHDIELEWVVDDDHEDGGYYAVPGQCPITGRFTPGDEDEMLMEAYRQDLADDDA